MSTFDFSKKYILENNFIKLIPLKRKHFKELATISNDDFIWKYLFEKGTKKKHIKTYLQKALQNKQLGKEYPFIIFDKKKEKIAGTTRVYDINSDWKTLKIGHTWIGKDFRGTGLNMHCKYLLFDFFFEKKGIERIGFGVHEENIRSIKALKKVGCQQEGVLKSFLPKVENVGRADLLLFSILREDWLDHAKQNLSKTIKNKHQ